MSLKEIAHRAGTSVSTVSRVLNQPDYKCKNPELEARIWAAAQEISYTPNTAAQTLKSGAPQIIEVNAETDFVAKNDKFVDFVKEATKVIMKQNPADVEALMACKTEAGETVDEALKNLILVIKENIKVRRFTRYEGVCSAYVHGGGTHGILVNFETTNDIDAKDEFVAYGKDIAMQVAAANPGYVDEASVPAEVVAKEKEIMLAQMAQDPKTANKPEAVKEKMIEGKIKKFFKENCLVDQEFVKDGDLTVAQYTAKVAKDLGGEIKIVKFARFVKGEGLEKRADDFASEVASMVK